MAEPYSDRAEAGRALAPALRALGPLDAPLVLALPRGGVPVAAEVARDLDAPLDVLVVRKLGVPRQRELAMGAIASGGGEVYDWDLIRRAGVRPRRLESIVAREREELRRRETAYRGDRPAPALTGRTVVIVDDGLATGATMLAAVQTVRAQAPARTIVAVPVGAPETVSLLAREADAIVCPLTPDPFVAVGVWYRDFRETRDYEVRRLLAEAAPARADG